jgi:alkanesulfonate monooxygenase SsuD/methylene tetrahydromethanopterin reductase-like flavin-dependent oxidoreductase (luciferase family)
MYGVEFGKPVQYMREYVTVLRQLLWEGQTDFDGEYFHAHGAPFMPINPPQIEIPLAGIRTAFFKLSGEIGDGILTGWSPLPYVMEVAKPAVTASAEAANRPVPPIMASLSIIPHPDRDVAKGVALNTLMPYIHAPAYQDMFAQAGYNIVEDGLTDALFDELFIYGTPPQIAERIEQSKSAGVDELMFRIEPVENPMVEFMTVAQIVGELS